MRSLVCLFLLFAVSPSWGSQAMTNIVDSAAAWDCHAAYTNNTLRIEAVEVSEWNPARRIDRLPFDMPFQLVVGPDAADRAAADAALTTVVTSMPTHIRTYFERHRLLAPLQQWMIRRFKPGVSNEAQYVSAAAHPNVWRAKDFDLVRLAAAAKGLTSNDVPMMAVLSPLYEGYVPDPIRRAEPLIDYPDPRPEQVYETPFGAAIVLRAMEQRRKFRFVAKGCPYWDRNVNFRWVSKQRSVRIDHLQGLRNKYPVERGNGELVISSSGGVVRSDVLVFARYGEGPWGPPSVISLLRIPNERRQYDQEGRIQSVQYVRDTGIIPQLYQNKPWRDVYVQDLLGAVVGFQRTREGEIWDVPYSIVGERVIETYSSDMPKETVKVRYFTRPDDPTTLDYEETSETVRYPDKPFVPRSRGEFPPAKRKRR